MRGGGMRGGVCGVVMRIEHELGGMHFGMSGRGLRDHVNGGGHACGPVHGVGSSWLWGTKHSGDRLCHVA